MEHGKLVRDRIPEIIRTSGSEPEIRTVEGPELLAALFEKLREEAAELQATEDHRLEELADVFEVLRGLATHMGFALRDVERMADEKRATRGGFEQGLWLVSPDREAAETKHSAMREELGYVLECDLDLILMLDARTGGPLIRHIADRAGLTLSGNVTAARSTLRCAGTRETDVEVSWPGGTLLVEDKVDAAFTPGQPESYRTEVEALRKDRQVASVLVCPDRRRVHYEIEAGDSFDCVITCEELAAVAEADDDRFSRAAAMLLRAAAEPRPTRPSSAVDLVRSEWGDGYRRVVAGLLSPDDRLPLGPGSLRTATAEWMYFPAAGIDPEAVWSFGHWLPGGEVRMDLMVEDEPTGLPSGAVAVPKPTMWWISVQITPVSFDQPAEDQRDAIAEAVAAALALRRWAAGASLRPKERPAKQ